MSKNFSDILKELREEKGLNQQQLASSLEVTRQTISNYENNKRVPNKEMLEIIADFFNVDMNYLYGQSEIKNKYQDFSVSTIILFPSKKEVKRYHFLVQLLLVILFLLKNTLKNISTLMKRSKLIFV